MPALKLSRTKKINASAEKVYAILGDFHTWPKWSPWLISEPDARVDIESDGKSYEWEGKRVGSGNMKVLNEKTNKSIHFDLNFLKPWKSHALTDFELTEVEGGVEVTWNMDSSLPFFMFFMKKMMVAMIGNDYDRGLMMLKDLAEDEEVHSKLGFEGESEFPGCTYVGIKRTTTSNKVAEVMGADFTAMRTYANSIGADFTKAFRIYHKWDMVKGKAVFTSALPVESIPTDLPSEYVSGNIPATKLYSLKHTGYYQHLGNAWSTMFAMSRNSKEFKQRKDISPFETYGNSPHNTAPKDLISYINFAIK